MITGKVHPTRPIHRSQALLTFDPAPSDMLELTRDTGRCRLHLHSAAPGESVGHDQTVERLVWTHADAFVDQDWMAVLIERPEQALASTATNTAAQHSAREQSRAT
jgi:hypothetical protein